MRLEEAVRPPVNYKTLFYGLKRNHPHNVAVIHPLAYVIRRILYSIVIVFMAKEETSAALWGVLLLAFTCVLMAALVAVESEWEDSLINM